MKVAVQQAVTDVDQLNVCLTQPFREPIETAFTSGSRYRGINKPVPSLHTQLSTHSGPRCNILSDLYPVHDEGKNQPSDTTL